MKIQFLGPTFHGIRRSLGLADTTVRGYLDKMSDAFIIRQLRPWYANVAKRQVRAPKTEL